MSVPQFGAPVPGWTPPPLPGPARLDGRHVTLERLDPAAHADDLFAANSADDAIWAYMPYGPFPDVTAYRSFLDGMATQTDPFFYVLRDHATGRAGGVASYLRITPAAGSIEVGHICLSPRLQRTPAATEAIALLMGWAFESGYRRFEWKCDAQNRPSRRAAERYGLSYEGIFRQAAVVKGRNRDTAWFAAIDSEWPALKAAFDTWLDPANFDDAGLQKVALSTLTHPLLVQRDPG